MLVTFARSMRYFIILMDGVTSLRHVEFLKEKTVEATLEILKRYIMEVEPLTGQRLLSVRVNRKYNVMVNISYLIGNCFIDNIYWGMFYL